jgi:hypothetical protein
VLSFPSAGLGRTWPDMAMGCSVHGSGRPSAGLTRARLGCTGQAGHGLVWLCCG